MKVESLCHFARLFQKLDLKSLEARAVCGVDFDNEFDDYLLFWMMMEEDEEED